LHWWHWHAIREERKLRDEQRSLWFLLRLSKLRHHRVDELAALVDVYIEDPIAAASGGGSCLVEAAVANVAQGFEDLIMSVVGEGTTQSALFATTVT
jgi:hypothetical protein